MKLITSTFLSAMAFVLATMGVVPGVEAQAQHFEFPFEVGDYNHCTEEDVWWTATLYATVLNHENNGGRAVYVDIWRWDGMVEGLQSGYLWSSHGVAPYVETYSVNGDPNGGFVLIEKSVLHPQTPGAPRIFLDANIRMRYNAGGDLVVDHAQYVYDCIGH